MVSEVFIFDFKIPDSNDALVSLISATSIFVGIAIAYIIHSISERKIIKERNLSLIAQLLPTFKAFRNLIYEINQIENLWKKDDVRIEFDNLNKNTKTNNLQKLLNENEFLTYYKAFHWIERDFAKDIIYESEREFSFDDLRKFKKYTNDIWYAFNNRNDIEKEINHSQLENLPHEKRQEIESLIKTIKKSSFIKTHYLNSELSIGLISRIAGEIEVSILDKLQELTFEIEKPNPEVLIRLYRILKILSFSGIILPIIVLLLFYAPVSFFLSLMLISVSFYCFLEILCIVDKLVKKKHS